MEANMNIVKLSPEYQFTVPEKIRKKMSLQAGRIFDIINSGNSIELIPVRPRDFLRSRLSI